MTLPIGHVLHNRYRIAQLVGQGGFGAVYRAWDQSLQQTVALKENFDRGVESQRRFEREAVLLAGLRHPNLPRVIDHFILPHQGQYLVMDFVEGQSLAQMLKLRGQPLGEAEAREWIRQVCQTVQYLHSRTPPIIHRDIKPDNIIITEDGRAMLVDFGISKLYEASRGTSTSAKAITPGYSPPEQYGVGKTDARSDVYALGATLYTLLTARVPPEAVDLISGTETLLPPRQANPAISEFAAQAIVAAMTPAVSQRVASVAHFEQILTGRTATPSPVPPPPSSTPPPAQTAQGRRRWLGAAVAGLVLVLVGALAWVALAMRQPDPATVVGLTPTAEQTVDNVVVNVIPTSPFTFVTPSPTIPLTATAAPPSPTIPPTATTAPPPTPIPPTATTAPPPPTIPPITNTYTNYVAIRDDSRDLLVEVPVEWADIDGRRFTSPRDGVVFSRVVAATNIDGYINSWVTPGMQFQASTALGDDTVEEILGRVDFASVCAYDGRFPYSDPYYSGAYDQFSNCAGSGTRVIVLGAHPDDRAFGILIMVQIVTAADETAWERIKNTFVVVGTSPGQ